MQKQPSWWLDELSVAGRENLDTTHVSRYDRKEDAGAGEEVALLQKFGLTRHSEIIDMGAGTGQFALEAALACRKVYAVDVSPLMLERLTSKLEKRKIKNIEVIGAGFLSYSHQGSPTDFIYSRLVLHHLPDFWKAIALKRIHSFMCPGGIFRLVDVIFDFDPQETEQRLEAFCARLGKDIEREWVREEMDEHIRDEYSTFRWLLEPMMEQCGFQIEEAEYSADGFFGKYILQAL